MQVTYCEELDKSDFRVAEAEAERLRSEETRCPNALAGAQAGTPVAVVNRRVKTELQAEAEAERLQLEGLHLNSIINDEADSDDGTLSWDFTLSMWV